jgi:hypothetical protein
MYSGSYKFSLNNKELQETLPPFVVSHFKVRTSSTERLIGYKAAILKDFRSQFARLNQNICTLRSMSATSPSLQCFCSLQKPKRLLATHTYTQTHAHKTNKQTKTRTHAFIYMCYVTVKALNLPQLQKGD